MKQTNFQSYIQDAGLEAKPHQSEGVAWMLEREHSVHNGVRGGIIADEMGLGKTIMMIGTMVSNLCDRTLIVLPVALLDQWKEQIFRTTGHEVLVYHGKNKTCTPLAKLMAARVVLVTYHEIQISLKEFSVKPESAVHKVPWDRIIYDEAHHLRNKTAIQNGAAKLKAGIKWMITGTPIQNRMQDMFSLCHVLGYEDTYYGKSEGMDEILAKVMLRRTKAHVGIGMPKLISTDVSVSWKNYDDITLADELQQVSISGFGEGFGDGIRNDVGEMNAAAKLLGMIRSKQMCVYPKMLQKKVEEYYDEGFFDEDYTKMAFRAVSGTSKLDAVFAKVKENSKNDNKKIVFCHFRMEMDELKKRFERLGLKTAIVDGRITGKKRSDLLTKLDLDILILQINTCCEGLNLQQFNEIYFVSPHWNPAVEDQAVARAHRMGQKKDVQVYRFYMQGCDYDYDPTSSLKTIQGSLETYCKFRQDRKREIYIK